MLPLLSEEPLVGNTLGFLAVDGTLKEKKYQIKGQVISE